MSIHHIVRKNLTHSYETKKNIKAGQIIQGKILKLFPDNKAQIQLGSNRFIAQLEVPLLLGEHYIFQVESTGDLLKLKVITGESINQSHLSTADLIRAIGLRASKNNVAFTQALVNDQVPFNKNELAHAFQLLNGAKEKEIASRVLKNMLIQQIPLTESIFKAFYLKETTTLTEQMTKLLTDLKSQPQPSQLTQNIMKQLSYFTNQPLHPKNVFMSQILTEAISDNQAIFNMLKSIGLINKHISFDRWKTEWESFANQHQLSPSSLKNSQLEDIALPYEIDEHELIQRLTHFKREKQLLQFEAETFNSKWSRTINEALMEGKRLESKVFHDLETDINDHIRSLLPNNRDEILKMMINNPVQLRQLLTTIQSFISNDLYNKVDEQLTVFLNEYSRSSSSPKEQFINQLYHTLLYSGITDEFLIANDITKEKPSSLQVWINTINDMLTKEETLTTKQTIEFKQDITTHLIPLLSDQQKKEIFKVLNDKPLQLNQVTQFLQNLLDENPVLQELELNNSTSLKSMLIQLVNQTENISTERAQQLLHFINGLQLNSVNETNHFIQASIQIPGEKLFLNEDLYIDFKSKKTSEGKVNSDFCRIMFYLNLHHLKETIIDMHIQKRLISITIFTEQKHIFNEFKLFQPSLKSGLNGLNYKLSNVTIKPLKNMKNAPIAKKQTQKDDFTSNTYEGIDYQV